MLTLFILISLFVLATPYDDGNDPDASTESVTVEVVPSLRQSMPALCGDRQVRCDDPGFVVDIPNLEGRGRAIGVALEQFTNNELGYIGCLGPGYPESCGCPYDSFFCTQTPTSMSFGTSSDPSLGWGFNTMRAVLGPQPFPTSWICLNAPDDALSATVLCQQLGYQVGSVERVDTNWCPEAHFDGSSWTTDGVTSDGFGKVYHCSKPCGDNDGDGVPNDEDNCPNTANPGQCDTDADGDGDACDDCIFGDENDPDRDSDGVPDVCDKCPGGNDNIDFDNDGMPDECDICPDNDDNYTDLDADGVPDCADNCVGTANQFQTDMDGDGVGDACDNCKRISNPNQSDSDSDEIGNACDNNICCVENRSDACQGLSDGNYQKCDDCEGYVACVGGYRYDMPCAVAGQVYNAVWPDSYAGFCADTSSTCQEPFPMPSVPKCVPPPPPMP